MLTQHYTFRCDVPGCDLEVLDVTTLARETPQPLEAWPPKPILPVGWRLLDEHIICPKHRVAIDGIKTQYGTFIALREELP